MNAIPDSSNILRRELPNGITILARENFHTQSVILTGSLRAGAIFEPIEKQGLVSFTAATLMRGTQHRDFATIHSTLEDVGASLSLSGGMHTVGFGGKSLSEDLSLLLDLLNDVIRYPTFPQNQVERLRGEILTSLKIRQQNTRYMAGQLFRKMAYPDYHPYHRNSSGEIETITNMTLDDLKEYHTVHFGPQGMIVVIVGAVKAEEAIAEVERVFGNWINDQQKIEPDLPDVPTIDSIQHQTLVIPGKSQADIVLGVPGPSRFSDDYQAAKLANNIFGLFGMFGRLGKEIREKQGLAYYSYSQMSGGIGPGSWRVIAGVDPSNVKKAVDSIRHEVDRIINEPIDPEEFADNQSNLIGSLPLQLEKNEGVAGTIYSMEYYQLGLDYLHTYPETINDLVPTQIQQAMANYWSANAFVLGVAGPALSEAIV